MSEELTNAEKLKRAVAIADDDPEAESLNGQICVVRAGGKMMLPDRHKIIVLSKTQAQSMLSELESLAQLRQQLEALIVAARSALDSVDHYCDCSLTGHECLKELSAAIELCKKSFK